MKILSLIAVFFILVAHRAASQTCHLREVDLCFATLVLHHQGNGMPTTEDEINMQCESVKEANQCFGNFSQKCMTPLQKQVVTYLLEGSENLLSGFCTPGAQLRTDYLKHGACIGEVTGSEDTRNCLLDIQAAIETLDDAAYEKRVPIGCCAYQRLMGCIHGLFQSKCGAESVDLGSKMISLALTDLPNLLCTPYDPKGPKCAGALPPPGTPPKGSNSNSALSRLLAAYLGN